MKKMEVHIRVLLADNGDWRTCFYVASEKRIY